MPALALVLAGCAAHRNVDLRDAPHRGAESAPIEIIVFSDFQCRFCQRAAAELARIQREHPNRVRIFYKHYTLAYHAQAEPAARAAEAARLQGKFWEMHDLLFARSDDLAAGSYEQLAAEIGLDMARFSADFASAETAGRVAADRAEGEALGLDGCPYFLINRVPFRGSYADLAARLENEMGAR